MTDPSIPLKNDVFEPGAETSPTSGRSFLHENGWPYLALLVLLCALPPLSIDLGLPALPDVASKLNTSTAQSGLTVGVFMAGFAVTPLAYGLLSDRYGRRPLLIAGLALFVLGGIGAAFAPSISWLLLARLVQGAGAGAGPTIAFAATRDRLRGAPMARRLAILTMLLNTAPIIAPSIGTVTLALAGWRGIYASLGLGGLLLFLLVACGFAETARPDATAAGRTSVLGTLAQNAAALRSRPDVLAFGAVYGLSAGSMFAYVSTSPLLLIQTLGATPAVYASLFAVTASAIVCGAYVSSRALRTMSADLVIILGLCFSLAGPAAAASLLLAGAAGLLPIVACMATATFGYGLIAPAAAQATLDPLPGLAGVTAAFMTSFQMICMSLSSLLAAMLFYRFGDAAMAPTMAGFALASGLCLIAGRLIFTTRTGTSSGADVGLNASR